MISNGQSISDLLTEKEIRPFPAVASQILSSCGDDNVTPRDLAAIIQCDPAVSFRVLRVANSSMYGFSGENRTIEHAIVAIGMRGVRNLAISAATADVFSGGEMARKHRDQLWQHSLACASVASRLARRRKIAAEEAFLAGLVHDVGKLVFFDAIADEYSKVVGDAGSRCVINIEQEAFGVCHQTLGQDCGEEWGLPDEINAAISFHHSPREAYTAENLVAVVYLADQLSKQWGLGWDVADSNNDDNTAALWEHVGFEINEDELSSIRDEAASDYSSMRDACGS